jgi:hypothetical protein
VLLDIWVKSPFGVTRPYDCTVVCRHRFNLESVQGENFERAGFTPPHVKRAVPPSSAVNSGNYSAGV